MGCGLPSWTSLIKAVLMRIWQDDPEMVSLLLAERNTLASRYAKDKAGPVFNQIVHECLYDNDPIISSCVRAIAESGVAHICNFNYDDLLEEAIQTNGHDLVVAVPGEEFEFSHDKITIFHPHGMLARFDKKAEIENKKIVFSEDDYHNLYSDPYSWANIAQLSLLAGYSVLFVGLSMQDPNLRRLIDVSRSRGFKNRHFAIFRDPITSSDLIERSKQSRLRELIELDMKSLGVIAWFIEDHNKLPEIIRSISVPYFPH